MLQSIRKQRRKSRSFYVLEYTQELTLCAVERINCCLAIGCRNRNPGKLGENYIWYRNKLGLIKPKSGAELFQQVNGIVTTGLHCHLRVYQTNRVASHAHKKQTGAKKKKKNTGISKKRNIDKI